MIKRKWFCGLILFAMLSACTNEELAPLHQNINLVEIPKGFDAIDFPEDNAYSDARWQLGKKLFYDPIMSLDSTISCSTCHKASLAFSDDIALSLGTLGRIGTRNSPTLANVAYHPYYTREGGVPTLEMQILIPIQEHNELGFNIVELAEKMKNIPQYVQMSQEAYDREPDAFVITRSIANFERSIISGRSKYDQYVHYANNSALNEIELKGMNLFFGDKTNCSLCHGGFNFSNYAFENNGLYLEYTDTGRYRLTGKDEDLALFKVPSLRNIELTAPYMHDGSIATLEQVIDHYNTGGKNHPHKNELIKPLGLNEDQKNQLLAFLKALTDDSFVNNPIYQN